MHVGSTAWAGVRQTVHICEDTEGTARILWTHLNRTRWSASVSMLCFYLVITSEYLYIPHAILKSFKQLHCREATDIETGNKTDTQ